MWKLVRLRNRVAFLLAAGVWLPSASAIEIVVDYRFDTQGFFDQPYKRDAIEGAAARYSRVITSSLLAAEPSSIFRIGFNHPGTGDFIQLSTASGPDSDPVAQPPSSLPPAYEYGFDGLEEDEWLLFVGGRAIPFAGIGGTGTGVNFTSLFDDLNGPLHRGLISNTPSDSLNDLPAWGGAITFNIDADWHFELDSASTGREIDFYSIALHEIGHVLGLSSTWNQWSQNVEGASYLGQNAVAAFNDDNGTSVDRLSLEDAANTHWQDGTHSSRVFSLGQPVLTGTVGNGLQGLLMEPSADFTNQIRRLELTNVDTAALVDVGWSILQPMANSLDVNADNVVDGLDVDLACSAGSDLTPYFADLGTVLADIDFDGSVQFSDFLTLSWNFDSVGSYSDGDISCDGSITFADFLTLAAEFGSSAATQSVPEPHRDLWIIVACAGWLLRGLSRERRGSRLATSMRTS